MERCLCVRWGLIEAEGFGWVRGAVVPRQGAAIDAAQAPSSEALGSPGYVAAAEPASKGVHSRRRQQPRAPAWPRKRRRPRLHIDRSTAAARHIEMAPLRSIGAVSGARQRGRGRRVGSICPNVHSEVVPTAKQDPRATRLPSYPDPTDVSKPVGRPKRFPGPAVRGKIKGKDRRRCLVVVPPRRRPWLCVDRAGRTRLREGASGPGCNRGANRHPLSLFVEPPEPERARRKKSRATSDRPFPIPISLPSHY